MSKDEMKNQIETLKRYKAKDQRHIQHLIQQNQALEAEKAELLAALKEAVVFIEQSKYKTVKRYNEAIEAAEKSRAIIAKAEGK